MTAYGWHRHQQLKLWCGGVRLSWLLVAKYWYGSVHGTYSTIVSCPLIYATAGHA